MTASQYLWYLIPFYVLMENDVFSQETDIYVRKSNAFWCYVASKVSEGSQHIGDKFYIVPGVVVDKKILHDLWWVDGWV